MNRPRILWPRPATCLHLRAEVIRRRAWSANDPQAGVEISATAEAGERWISNRLGAQALSKEVMLLVS